MHVAHHIHSRYCTTLLNIRRIYRYLVMTDKGGAMGVCFGVPPVCPAAAPAMRVCSLDTAQNESHMHGTQYLFPLLSYTPHAAWTLSPKAQPELNQSLLTSLATHNTHTHTHQQTKAELISFEIMLVEIQGAHIIAMGIQAPHFCLEFLYHTADCCRL